MIKHVNFTGRRRIPRSCVDILLRDGSPRTFDASIDLTKMQMPAGAKLYLEAMCAGSSVIQRFPFGVVEKPAAPARRTLDDIDGESVFFALKVVDESQWIGRLLGLAENIQPKQADKPTEAGRRGILPILPAPLGQELWRMEFDWHGEVCLLVNEAVPNIKDRTRWDPLLQSAIYPAAVRTIVTEALERGASDEDDDDGRWPTRWLRFAKSVHPDKIRPPVEGTPEDRQEWVEDVVAEFCSKHNLVDQFCKRLRQLDGEET